MNPKDSKFAQKGSLVLKSPLPLSVETSLQHAGSEHRLGHGLVGALETSVTFTTPRAEDPPVYSRLGNTTNHREIESLLATLHETERAIVTGSGMSAFTLMFFSLLKPGDHVLVSDPCYGGTYHFFTKMLQRWGVATTFAPIDTWAQHLRQETKMVLAESITNPFCLPLDLSAVAAFAKKHQLLSVCDNTFASPILCKPMALGFDLVMESATKYLNGHSDVISGMVAGSQALINTLAGPHAYLGTFLPPPQCVQLARGVRTLKIRMDAHCKNGEVFANAMGQSSKVAEVFYGCAHDSPLKTIFPRGFGGMVGVRFKPDVNVKHLLSSCKWVSDVPSLGGTESTATMPYYTTNWFMNDADKKRLGIDEQLVRFSIGLEDPQDIVNDVLKS